MWGLHENYIIILSQQGTSSLGGRKESEPMDSPPNHGGTNLWVSSPLKHFAQRSHPLKDIYMKERDYIPLVENTTLKYGLIILSFFNYAVDLQPHYMNSDQNNNDNRD
jgi:hypothetical protein